MILYMFWNMVQTLELMAISVIQVGRGVWQSVMNHFRLSGQEDLSEEMFEQNAE